MPNKLVPATIAPGMNEDVRRRVEIDTLRRHLTGAKSSEEKLDEAAKGFESVFIGKLWKQMRNSVPKEGYLHSREEEFYVSMFDEEVAKKFASAGGIGLASMLKEQLREQLKASSSATASGTVAPVAPIALEKPHGSFDLADNKPIELAKQPIPLSRNTGMYEPLSPPAYAPSSADVLPDSQSGTLSATLSDDLHSRTPEAKGNAFSQADSPEENIPGPGPDPGPDQTIANTQPVPNRVPAFSDSALAQAMELATRIELAHEARASKATTKNTTISTPADTDTNPASEPQALSFPQTDEIAASESTKEPPEELS